MRFFRSIDNLTFVVAEVKQVTFSTRTRSIIVKVFTHKGLTVTLAAHQSMRELVRAATARYLSFSLVAHFSVRIAVFSLRHYNSQFLLGTRDRHVSHTMF